MSLRKNVDRISNSVYDLQAAQSNLLSEVRVLQEGQRSIADYFLDSLTTEMQEPAPVPAQQEQQELDKLTRWVVMCTTHPLPLGDVEAWTLDEAVQKYLKVKAVSELVNSGAAPQFYVKTWDEVIGQANARVEPAQEMRIYKR